MPQLDTLFQRLQQRLPGLDLRKGEPMRRYTTFRVGGPAALMAFPATEEEVRTVLQEASALGIRPFFLGNGSNLLVSDRGYSGLMIKLSGDLDSCRRQDNRLIAGGGILLSRLASAALENGLTGLEFASGIPGTLGGGICMNAGAYGGELCQVVTAVRVMDGQGNAEDLPREACDFGYRHSAFLDGQRLVLNAVLELTPEDPQAIRQQMEELGRRRREKQPLEYPSAGSTFKRPPGHFAAALIDQCGLKGLTVGGAQVSEKHAGFVINRGGATCADIRTLMEQVQHEVLRQTGVTLEPEVRYLGD